jgi:polyphosphate kinase
MFCNDNKPKMYLASADLMTRNLSRRIEVAFPVLASGHRREIEDILLLQCRDNRKAREIDDSLSNRYVRQGPERHRAQADIYGYAAALLAEADATAERVLSWSEIDGTSQETTDYGAAAVNE